MVEPAQPWHVPVRLADVPETGLHLDLVADAQVRAGLAALGDVTAMPRLEAVLDVVRHGQGLRVTGRVSATVEQNCVVTLEPVQNEVDEPIDVVFAPPAHEQPAHDLTGEGHAPGDEDLADERFAAGGVGATAAGEPPEVLSADGTADVGAIAAEFLLLGIDPYPRKPGAEFKPLAEQGAGASPFAPLAKLRKELKNGRH
ncbi:MAG: DUF177 domain-containing protein [Bradyrhizobiaceae bacterium]|nr:DUF177 domain-containing protein [Bradyrhizobiaceae bacterium]